MCCLNHTLVSAVSSTQLHSACRHGAVCRLQIHCDSLLVSIAGMLTITDFIIILHRYYKSPMVGPLVTCFLHIEDFFLFLFLKPT